MMLRTIRLDPSDTFVFPLAAEPGEWAVTGSFLFWGRDVGSLAGKERAAFRSGFVGVDSLGFSTLVVCQPIKPEERAAAIEALAAHLVAKLGAPSLDAARAAAEEEIALPPRSPSMTRARSSRSIAARRTARSANSTACCSGASAPKAPTACMPMPAPSPSTRRWTTCPKSGWT